MVDSATQDRLFPSGYQQIDIRSSSTTFNDRLNSLSRQRRFYSRSADQMKTIETRRNAMNFVRNFHMKISTNRDEIRSNKLIGKYLLENDWPRSICCLKWTDGSIVVCQRNSHRLLLFTSRLILRSTCGGKHSGVNQYQFDCPTDVAPIFFSSSSSNIIVSDSNNRRIQFFSIGNNGEFIYQSTLKFDVKPIYLTSNVNYFVVSFDNGSIYSYSIYQNLLIGKISLRKISSTSFRICLDENQSNLFVANPIDRISRIYQLTIDGKFLREISLKNFSFFRLDSFIFDSIDEKLIVADSLNSIIYSIDLRNDDKIEIDLEPTDSLNSPSDICLGKEGHLFVVESNLINEHQLKIFRFHSCLCHSYLTQSRSTIKSSLLTSFRRF